VPAASRTPIYAPCLLLYYRAAVPPQARRIGELEAERGRLLALLPARQRALITARQEDAADGQGSDKWIFPAPILKEGAFRERERQAEAEARPVRSASTGG
jgi:hypothetical protein